MYISINDSLSLDETMEGRWELTGCGGTCRRGAWAPREHRGPRGEYDLAFSRACWLLRIPKQGGCRKLDLYRLICWFASDILPVCKQRINRSPIIIEKR